MTLLVVLVRYPPPEIFFVSWEELTGKLERIKRPFSDRKLLVAQQKRLQPNTLWLDD